MKNHFRLMTLIKKLSLGLLVFVVPQVAMADSVPATVTTIKGDVTVTDASGKDVPVTQGSKLSAGDTIKTGATGTVGLTLTPGSGTVVEPSTVVKISSLDFNKGADGSNNRNIRLNLKNGSLISTLFKKDGHSDFQIATPYGVAAAKGTSWEVTVAGNSMTVDVATGVVTVSGGPNGTVSVNAGDAYNSATGAITALPQSVIDAILNAIEQALPNLTQGQKANLLNDLQNATINPATVNSSSDINSPNK